MGQRTCLRRRTPSSRSRVIRGTTAPTYLPWDTTLGLFVVSVVSSLTFGYEHDDCWTRSARDSRRCPAVVRDFRASRHRDTACARRIALVSQFARQWRTIDSGGQLQLVSRAECPPVNYLCNKPSVNASWTRFWSFTLALVWFFRCSLIFSSGTLRLSPVANTRFVRAGVGVPW